jgi:L-cystine uptake protein TcyP (sodium:dicarboxylate symporter family)
MKLALVIYLLSVVITSLGVAMVAGSELDPLSAALLAIATAGIGLSLPGAAISFIRAKDRSR